MGRVDPPVVQELDSREKIRVMNLVGGNEPKNDRDGQPRGSARKEEHDRVTERPVYVRS